jgi:hypothetical protein
MLIARLKLGNLGPNRKAEFHRVLPANTGDVTNNRELEPGIPRRCDGAPRRKQNAEKSRRGLYAAEGRGL